MKLNYFLQVYTKIVKKKCLHEWPCFNYSNILLAPWSRNRLSHLPFYWYYKLVLCKLLEFQKLFRYRIFNRYKLLDAIFFLNLKAFHLKSEAEERLQVTSTQCLPWLVVVSAQGWVSCGHTFYHIIMLDHLFFLVYWLINI